MARRKNVKRIDPRYFLAETVNRNDDGSALEEAGWDPPHFSPLSSTEPGKRIPEPGSQRPLEDRGLGQHVEGLFDLLDKADEYFLTMATKNWGKEVAVGAKGAGAPKEVHELRDYLRYIRQALGALAALVKEDPRAPKLGRAPGPFHLQREE